MGAQWFSGRVLDLRTRGCGLELLGQHCIVSLSKYLVLVQPMKARPDITEILLTGM